MYKRIYITDFGANCLYEDNAEYIQAAIDSLEDGGMIIIPAGEYKTGALSLKSDICIYLESGAVLKAHHDIGKYVETEFRDSFGKNTIAWITAYNCTNIKIAGYGSIDMIGSLFVDFDRSEYDMDMSEEEFLQTPARPLNRPTRPIVFAQCTNIDISDVKIVDSPCWTITFHDCNCIKVRGITVMNNQRIPHNDGIHFSACKNVIVNDCDFTCGDDCIAITSLFDYSLTTDGVIISNCHMSSRSAAIRVGHISSHVKNVLISNIVIRDTNRGIAVFAGDAGKVENVRVSNILMETRLYAGGWWGKGEPMVICSYNSTGIIENVFVNGLLAKSENPVIVAGENIRNIKFTDCSFDIDFEKYSSDEFELNPNGFLQRNKEKSIIANLSDSEVINK